MVEFSSAVVDGASRYVVLKNQDTLYLSLDFDTVPQTNLLKRPGTILQTNQDPRHMAADISFGLNDKIKIPRLPITSSPLWSTIPSSNARGNQL